MKIQKEKQKNVKNKKTLPAILATLRTAAATVAPPSNLSSPTNFLPLTAILTLSSIGADSSRSIFFFLKKKPKEKLDFYDYSFGKQAKK